MSAMRRTARTETALTGPIGLIGLIAVTAALSACGPGQPTAGKDAEHVALSDVPERVYWGDTHLHTSNSVDAFGFGNRLGPEEALRFARGEEVTSSTGITARLARPLDFLVISDHSDGLGSTKALYEAPRIFIREPILRRWYDMMHSGPAGSLRATGEMIDAKAAGTLPTSMTNPADGAKRTKSVWYSSMKTVEHYNDPGKFTAFLGFEYTLMNGGNNLHRNVIFRDGGDKVGAVSPLGSFGQITPDTLWDYMDAYERATGGKVLAIPHNSNLSNGTMFELTPARRRTDDRGLRAPPRRA